MVEPVVEVGDLGFDVGAASQALPSSGGVGVERSERLLGRNEGVGGLIEPLRDAGELVAGGLQFLFVAAPTERTVVVGDDRLRGPGLLRSPDGPIAGGRCGGRDTFLVAWKRLDQIEEVDAALPWLYATAYRIVCHQLRGRSRARNLAQRLRGLAVAEAETTDSMVMRREQGDLVTLAASRLRAIDQEILRLELWEGLSHAEVAVALAIKPEAVRQRVSRARRNLTKEYDKVTRERRPRLLSNGGDP